MTTTQIAHRLAELCDQGGFKGAQKELFAEDAISIEPESSPGLKKKQKAWLLF